MAEHPDEGLFDWVAARALAQDGDAGGVALLRYTEHLLATGMGEDMVRECLLGSGLSSADAAALIVAARGSRLSHLSPPDPPLLPRSGAYDFGRVFDHLSQQEAQRREGRRQRKERREKSARLAATEPDPAFALDGLPTYAQVVTHEAHKADRRAWLWAVIVLVVIMLPFLVFGIAALSGAFR